jgi:hypothetical protein
MDEKADQSEAEVKASIVKQIIPGASPELVREVVEDQMEQTIPKPASEEVELERIRRAQAEDSAD